MTVPTISSVIAQQKLKDPAQQLKLYAKTARRLAVEKQHPFQILLTEKEYVLSSLEIDSKTNKPKVTQLMHYKIPSGITFTAQRWNTKELKKPADELWVFQPSGILEPVHVRFQNKNSWIDFTFHPLTAGSQNETSNFQN